MDLPRSYSTPGLQAGTLTFLLTDVEGSTARWQVEAEAMRKSIWLHDELMTLSITEHKGHILTERGEGDSFFAIFARPSDALAAALAAQQRLQRVHWRGGPPLQVRMAIHVGEAGGDYRGPDVNCCARLRSAAHGGQVLVSASAEALIRGHLPAGATLVDEGRHRLKDLHEPLHVFQLGHPSLRGDFPPLRSLENHHHNLPIQLTSFIGREHEVTEIRRMLEAHRLVTLTGPGGSGKTRLALQVAGELIDSFDDGIWFVDLAPVIDSTSIPGAFAMALGFAEEPGRNLADVIGSRLRGLELLLVVDNCEHLLEGVAKLIEVLLQSNEQLIVLTTSRESLRLAGEHRWLVPPLVDIEAVHLFRTRASGPLEPWTELEPAVAEICKRLDGIPLAIELAARRVETLGLAELVRRLEDRFKVLTGGSRTALPRQQTLRGAIAWSHDLLTDDERRLFRILAVFDGGFDLEACQAVCGEELSPLDGLSNLVDKSLLVVEPRGAAVRYRLLDTLHAFAAERLQESGEANEFAHRHLDHYLELANEAYQNRLRSGELWLQRLEQDHNNLSRALEFSVRSSRYKSLLLVGALGWFWKEHSHYMEGRRWLDLVLKDPHAEGAALARAVGAAGLLATWVGDHEGAHHHLLESLRLWRAAGGQLEVALALEALGWHHFSANEEVDAQRRFEECLDISRELDDESLIIKAMSGVSQILVALHETGRARPLAQELLTRGRRSNDLVAIHNGFHYLADVALIEGDCETAEAAYRDSLLAILKVGDQLETSFEIQGGAMAAAGLGRASRALVLGGAMEMAWERLGADVEVRFWTGLMNRYFGMARTQLGPEAAAATWLEGRAMSFDDAVRYALEQSS
ncbi:MAG TPA: NB-ARC domain-containing protein [Candidatus Dormibacteraeota bacterium]|nr:NB-ARC domain-containing protein [Candidatus Dormibacteraeota bacterium]